MKWTKWPPLQNVTVCYHFKPVIRIELCLDIIGSTPDRSRTYVIFVLFHFSKNTYLWTEGSIQMLGPHFLLWTGQDKLRDNKAVLQTWSRKRKMAQEKLRLHSDWKTANYERHQVLFGCIEIQLFHEICIDLTEYKPNEFAVAYSFSYRKKCFSGCLIMLNNKFCLQ